jgi:hypothetical protein
MIEITSYQNLDHIYPPPHIIIDRKIRIYDE